MRHGAPHVDDAQSTAQRPDSLGDSVLNVDHRQPWHITTIGAQSPRIRWAPQCRTGEPGGVKNDRSDHLVHVAWPPVAVRTASLIIDEAAASICTIPSVNNVLHHTNVYGMLWKIDPKGNDPPRLEPLDESTTSVRGADRSSNETTHERGVKHVTSTSIDQTTGKRQFAVALISRKLKNTQKSMAWKLRRSSRIMTLMACRV